jgi:hypothetical protein
VGVNSADVAEAVAIAFINAKMPRGRANRLTSIKWLWVARATSGAEGFTP